VPSWSLALEVQFYLLAPLLILFVSERKLPIALVTLIALVPFIRLFMYLYYPSIFVYTLLPCRMDALLLGMLCACLLRNARVRGWLEAEPGKLRVTLSVLLGGVAVLNLLPFCSRTSFEMVFFGYTWLGIFYACLLLVVVTAKRGAIISVMRNIFLRRLGVIAYGVFLMHLGIAGLTHGWLRQSTLNLMDAAGVLATLVALGLTLLLATFSWRYFEKPIMNWGRWSDQKIKSEA
jgi:peptidoglycan/LPS O-acetylase OafA/YrhL